MQVVPAAELFALCVFLEYGQPDDGIFEFYTDCAYVFNGFHAGKVTNTSGWSVHAGIWAKIHNKLDDIGYDNVFVYKVKAHQKLTAHTPALLRFLIQGNGWADVLAKRGVNLHNKNDIMRKSIKEDHVTVISICKFITLCYIKHRESRPDAVEDRFDRVIPSAATHFGGDAWRRHEYDCIGGT